MPIDGTQSASTMTMRPCADAGGVTGDGDCEAGHGDGEREPARQRRPALGQQRRDQRTGKRNVDREGQHLKSPVRQQVHDRGVDGGHDELGHKAEQKHEADDRRESHALGVMQIGKSLAQCSGTGP